MLCPGYLRKKAKGYVVPAGRIPLQSKLLCPDNKISGAKIIGKGRLPTNNRATNALKMAASGLRTSNTYLMANSMVTLPFFIIGAWADLGIRLYQFVRISCTTRSR